MKLIFILWFVLLFGLLTLKSQKWNFGLGLEVHRSALKEKPGENVKVPYTLGLKTNVGISGRIILEYKISKYVHISLNPTLGTYRLGIENRKNSFLITNHYNLGLGARYNHSGLTAGIEVGFTRFYDMYFSQTNNYRDLDKYILSRNIMNYSFLLGFSVHKDSYVYLKTTSYSKDLFGLIGFDNIGREVSPIFVRPKILSLGVNYFIQN